jgi:plasmid stabilization system protein ParE
MFTEWTKRAEKDLFSNIAYIAEQSPKNAMKVANDILEFVETLKDYPYKYPKEKFYYRENIRFAIKYRFKIVYRVEKKSIIIMRLFHTKQNPNKI